MHTACLGRSGLGTFFPTEIALSGQVRGVKYVMCNAGRLACHVWHLSLIVVRWLSDDRPMEAEAKKGDVTVTVTETVTLPDIEVMDEDEDEDEDEDAWGKSGLALDA